MNLEQWWQDFRVSGRGLWRAKAFTGAAVLTLALGIAGTTVMFALIQGVLLRPFPVQEQDRLILAWKEVRTSASARYPFGNAEIEAVARNSQLLEKAAGVTRNGVERSVVTDNGVSTYANVALVTGGFFEVLGVQPILGRTLTVADEKDGAENVIVVSSGFWQRRYGASREVVGRPLTIFEQPFRIVGVMPGDLDYPTGVDVWRTTSSVPTTGPFGDAAQQEVNLIGRLRPGVMLEQATSEITALSRRLDAEAPPSAIRDLVPVVRPFADVIVGDTRTALLAISSAVVLVLLIAAANVANLLLMHGEARRGEHALRAALGAGRSRIVRQMLAESVVLAALSGVTGFAVTWWTLQPLVTLVPDGLPRLESVRIDGAVVLFSIAVVFVTALLAGLAPALVSMRADLVSQLRAGGQGLARASTTRGRRTLIVAQVALAVAVIGAAGLLIQTVLRLQSVDLGFPADRLVLLDLHIPQTRYAERRQHAQFLDETIAQLETVPGIAAATPVNVSPSGQGWDLPRFTVEGQDADQAAANPSLNLESVHPNYFAAFEVPLVHGRAFAATDREGAVPVAIISEDVAARMWPGEDPVGRRLKMGRVTAQGRWYTVVGVAGHTRYRDVMAPRPTLYLPAAQFQMTATLIVVRTAASLEQIAPLVRDRVRVVARDVQVMRVAPFAEMLSRPLAHPRFNAFVLTVFGIAALLLSTIGLYGVMATSVRRRQSEIGIRLALGASASDVRRLVLQEGLWVATLGAGLGLAGAMMAGRVLRTLLFEVDPLDPLAMLGAAILVVGTSTLACCLPALRASRVNPVVALHSE